MEFCHQNKIPSISVCEGGYYNTPYIKEEHFLKNNLDKCFYAVNKAQRTADNLDITIRWNSPILYFSKEENRIISNRNRIAGCINFFFSAIITPDFKLKICPLSEPVYEIKDDNLQNIWNNKDLLRCRDIILQNNFPSTCRYCTDYNEYFDKHDTGYSFIDYQKRTHYWKL